MNRRAFLQTLAAAPGFAAPQSAAPIKLGFDTYSLRAFGWKLPRFLDYAHAQKLDTIQISSMSDYESYEPAYLQKMKDQAARYKLTLDAGMGCICPLSRSYSKNGPPVRDRLIQGLQVARAVGATSMRCYLGAAADRLNEPGIEACMAETIKVFKSVRSEALDLGVKIALENHSGDLQAREVKTIIEEAGKDYVAACLDTGNPMWCIEDPFVTLETLSPWVVTTHIRDSCVFETPRGAAAQWVALGDGVIDFKKFVADFRRLCPQSGMQIENITGRPPTELPYLEPGFWKAFPRMPAAEFARFVRLAKNGRPFMGSMIIGDVPGARPQAVTDALKEQQRLDLERSFAYARKILNIGVNWRA